MTHNPLHTPAGIHHVNILVRDLDTAVRYYQEVLGLTDVVREALPSRGVLTARFKLGHAWIVLVMPTDAAGAPGRHLAAHGEGVFLLSFGITDVQGAADALERRIPASRPEVRTGLAGWRVLDLPDAPGSPCVTQLCEDAAWAAVTGSDPR